MEPGLLAQVTLRTALTAGRAPAVHHRSASNTEAEAQTEAQEQQEASRLSRSRPGLLGSVGAVVFQKTPLLAQLNLHIWLSGLLQSLGENTVTAPG